MFSKLSDVMSFQTMQSAMTAQKNTTDPALLQAINKLTSIQSDSSDRIGTAADLLMSAAQTIAASAKTQNNRPSAGYQQAMISEIARGRMM
jgi:hypothetical protein